MNTVGEGVKKAPETITTGYEHDNVTLDVLATLQSSNLIVSKRPFRIEMKNVTDQDVTLMNNLYVPIVDKKIKYIIGELLQNIVIKQAKEYAKHSHFVLEQKDGMLHIEASNYMEVIIKGKDKEAEIEKRIDEINHLPVEDWTDKEGKTQKGLRKICNEILSNSMYTATG
jgi:hypothetical protein